MILILPIDVAPRRIVPTHRASRPAWLSVPVFEPSWLARNESLER